MTDQPDLHTLLAARYDDPPPLPGTQPGAWRAMAARGSCRTFAAEPVPDALLDTLCALALASPTKSDLQQRDIVLVTEPEARTALADLVAGQPWVAGAPVLAVFCGNNRRQRLLHDWHDVPFANDHFDAPFNAAVDAGIALAAFVTAAEAAGLGCCPVSAVRNEAAAVSDLLGLPDHVFPVAGLALGWPAAPPEIAMRLPLRATVHRNRYAERDLRADVAAYDAARASRQPYRTQRFAESFGESPGYGWSEDKVRQYSRPERADFGAFLRAKGFRFD
ncbi:nitroreductase family protein [Jannaschia formosa]|uniref:nitroreductase family protein n=1 Tax=Jannaschia formosa TaxID=2259592 RepID=UPI000E1BC161|nr:nitroreductase family protein [Jannaschia formosa]TFL17590.1 NADPH-dependent oxidoreductase [Jannaschia formosa]